MSPRYRQSSGVVSTDLDGEAVLLDHTSGEYYVLNETGRFLWGALSSPVDTSALVQVLVNEYEVARGEAQTHVQSFIADLVKRGLVSAC